MKKYFTLFLLYLILLSCRASEITSTRIWDMEADTVEENLISGNIAFIESLNFNRLSRRHRLGEISRYGEGGAYYFSFLMEKTGREEWQIRFLQEELRNGVYQSRAAEKLHEILSERGEWSRLTGILSHAFPDGEMPGSIADYYIEALYENGQHRELLKTVGDDLLSLPAAKAYIIEKKDLKSPYFSNYLYSRADISGTALLWQLINQQGRNSELDENLKVYMEMCNAYTAGDSDSLKRFLLLFNLTSQSAEAYPSLVYRLRAPVLEAGLGTFWAERLGEINTFESAFTAARLYRSEKMFGEAERLYRKANLLAGSRYEEDRSLWYLMDLYSSNTSYLAGLMEETISLWNNPVYFSDLLEEILSSITAESRWGLLERLYPLIVRYGDSESSAAFSWVRINSPDFYKLDQDQKDLSISRLLDASHFSYYNILGHFLSGKEFLFNEEPYSEERTDADRFILGFYDFGLSDEALDMSRGLEDLLSPSVISKLSRQAAEEGDYLRSIQLAGNLSPVNGLYYSKEEIKLKYPQVYDEEIRRYSREYEVPYEILKGIIRTESAFTHDIVSYAGAVGLSQLMPETAADQARKLGIGTPDLTDPETNIRIGSSYVRWILDRPWSENLSQMLIAYNGGGGNLRKWKRIFNRHRDELFVEAIPYKETRNYVKKVLTSSVVYGSVYEGSDPLEIVLQIYPDFKTLIEGCSSKE